MAKRPAPRPRNVAQIARQELLRRLGVQWAVGQWLPSVAELARLLGAGHVSTHRAVVQLAREGYLLPLRGKGTRVLKAGPTSAGTRQTRNPGSRVSLISPAAAASFPPGIAPPTRSPQIAIVRSAITDPMIHRMIDAFMEAAKPMGPQFRFLLTDGREEVWQLPEPVDAAVLFNQPPNTFPGDLAARAKQLISVMTGTPSAELWRLGADVVTIDQQTVGRLAGQRLRQSGCECVCYIGRYCEPGRYDATSLARLRGFEEGWGEPLADEYQMFGRWYGPKTGRQGYLRWTKLSPRPQGIFAASDELAMGVLGAAVMEGLRPGIDFQLVGVDGQERSRNATGFPLTSVQMPVDAMGRQAARLLRQRLLEGETQAMHVALGCTLFAGLTAMLPEERAAHLATQRADAMELQAKSS
jgi:DNA-binding LacI/PurR family transcriptional regulator